MEKKSKIYIAGHSGLVGSAITCELKQQGYHNLITRTHKELDLLDFEKVADFFEKEKPEYIFLAAAKVGGILANRLYSAQFIYENLQIQNNIIHNAYLHKVKKLLYLGSSCIYPRHCPQPMKEEYLLTGKPEPTNEQYTIAKIAGITMCQSYNKQYGTNYICAVPTNAYGTNDNFHPDNCHVIPALIFRMHDAKIKNIPYVTAWGSGKSCREFLFADDLANAIVFLMQNYSDSDIINIGTGHDLTIYDLAMTVYEVIDYKGKLQFDTTKPDGMPQKLLDVTKLNKLGWKTKTDLKTGLKITYEWYLKNIINSKNLVSQLQTRS